MKRLWNLFKGWFNQYIYALEAESPEVVYDNAISQVVNSYKLLKGKAAAVTRRYQELKDETASTQGSLNKVNELLEAAAHLPEDQVDLDAASEMVRTQEQLKEKLSGLVTDLAVAETDVKDVMSALLEVESEKKKLIAEKDSNIGRFRSAQARLAVMERQDGTSIDAINQSLTGVRSNIKNVIAEANLTKQLQANTLENKVKAFTQATEGQSAKQKFLQMREAARQTSSGVDVQSGSGKQLTSSATVSTTETTANKQIA